MATHLTLFVRGDGLRSRRIAASVRAWCDHYLNGDYQLDVVDILEWPVRADQAQVLATPVLLLASPPRRVVGDFSDMDQVMEALGLPQSSPQATA